MDPKHFKNLNIHNDGVNFINHGLDFSNGLQPSNAHIDPFYNYPLTGNIYEDAQNNVIVQDDLVQQSASSLATNGDVTSTTYPSNTGFSNYDQLSSTAQYTHSNAVPPRSTPMLHNPMLRNNNAEQFSNRNTSQPIPNFPFYPSNNQIFTFEIPGYEITVRPKFSQQTNFGTQYKLQQQQVQNYISNDYGTSVNDTNDMQSFYDNLQP